MRELIVPGCGECDLRPGRRPDWPGARDGREEAAPATPVGESGIQSPGWPDKCQSATVGRVRRLRSTDDATDAAHGSCPVDFEDADLGCAVVTGNLGKREPTAVGRPGWAERKLLVVVRGQPRRRPVRHSKHVDIRLLLVAGSMFLVAVRVVVSVTRRGGTDRSAREGER